MKVGAAQRPARGLWQGRGRQKVNGGLSVSTAQCGCLESGPTSALQISAPGRFQHAASNCPVI